MKLILCAMVLAATAFASGAGSVASWQSFGGVAGEEPEVTVLESDIGHIVVRIDVPGFYLYDQPAGGRAWNRVEMPECYPQGEVGLPELPSVTRLFALPYGTLPEIEVLEVRSTEYENIELLPRQTPEIDMPHVPYPFVIDDEYYHEGSIYPSSLAYVDQPGSWSGLNVSRLVVNPLRYDPSTGILEAVSSITVSLDFQGALSSVSEFVNPAMVPAMEDMVLNWSDFQAFAVPPDGLRDDGVEYVFVCTPDNVDWVSELFETHHYLGLHTKVETLAAPATITQIRNAIYNNYLSGVTRFACIVGTYDELPSYNYSSFVGDYYYSLMDSDLYADVAVGRITGDSAEVAIQVDKILSGYMDYDFSAGNTPGIIPSETVLAAHEEEYPGKYTLCCNQIASYSYGLSDITFTLLFPPEGATKDDLKDAINGNIGTVGYRGHGQYYCWQWAPGWVGNDIMTLSNSFMMPVFNIACLNGMYQTANRCISEAWQWSECGASGNLGANTSSYTVPNHDYMKQIYIALYDTGLFRVVEAINAATIYTINAHGSLGITNSRMYLWFGDPAMEIWTFDTAGLPGELEISHPANILPGNQDILITVTDGGTPVSGVNVTLTDGVDNYGDGMTFYEEGTTDGSGQVTINIDAPSSGTVYIGAWKHDYRYDIKWVLIGTGLEGSTGTGGILSVGSPYPNPVTGACSVGFSVPGAGAVNLSVYDVSGRMVDTVFQGHVEAGSHSVQWTPGSSISSGMYFLKLDSPEGSAATRAMVIR
ncbi:MAG: T9SS type A sorting domain-containing protein [Candidatus Fermentibacteraceae bacterium]|nr:T9SS type A sorting domain-containing protein [Candidatus Fermentibacteraceae bacterium]MBN2609547.1 T9SS type A sorting domain-containing protein [Candidatus Fermentibacteraceae bacterium]